ncbi:hypothetical protein T07_6165 [Trichinella nelsoni]|uniref:MULE transposase domain-containing protein n=2 Tax=Trichinella nelsoni TaxID=6336 RepID=A0A0V0SFD9_9BILA|nr:hypothetical protein T07_6165 [Trichinella nelsoni]
MANLPELHLVQNRCGGTSLVYEGRAYKLKRAARKKYWRCSQDKKGCGGATKPSFRATKAGEDFLLWQCASKHILIFSMADKIRLLAAMKTWAMDGTFKVVRQWYQQLFTIHAFVVGKLVPAVYRLCTGKDIGTYGFIFQALLNKVAVLGVNLNPQTIICDFQTALIPAIQGYFPNTRVQGCYFHFCHAVHRKAAMKTLAMDGTFKVVRQWYQQLFTIHAFVAGKLVPAVYRLCTGKDIGTYGFIFQALLNKVAVLGVNLNPQTIICDFQTALIPAIQGYLLNTRVQGCYFHFCQAVDRKVAMKTWAMDGTFKVVPQWYQQLFTIHAFVAALIPAIQGYFPNTRVQGCYFHFCQAVHRKVALVPFVTRKLEVLLQHSRFFKQIIQYSDITPGRGNYNLVHEGRVYNLKRTNMEDKQWVCRRVKKGCRGSIHTNLDKKNALKRRAAEEMKTVPQIFHEEASSASADLETASQFPTYKSVKTAMYRKRAQKFPRLPPTRQQLEIPPQWRMTKSDRRFLLYNNVYNSILIFCTEENLSVLSEHSVWSMDGTFKIVPEWYQQMFTIHVFIAGKLVPLVYCLTVHKDLSTYREIFDNLILKAAALGVVLQPQTVICDFETALIPALQGTFPGVNIQGCYFYFCQAVLRKVTDLGNANQLHP